MCVLFLVPVAQSFPDTTSCLLKLVNPCANSPSDVVGITRFTCCNKQAQQFTVPKLQLYTSLTVSPQQSVLMSGFCLPNPGTQPRGPYLRLPRWSRKERGLWGLLQWLIKLLSKNDIYSLSCISFTQENHMTGNVERQCLGMDQMIAARADAEYALFCRHLHSSIHFVLITG